MLVFELPSIVDIIQPCLLIDFKVDSVVKTAFVDVNVAYQ